MIYEVKVRNKVNHHQSDWCQGHNEEEASRGALENYQRKYPEDRIEPASPHPIFGPNPLFHLEHLVRPAHPRTGLTARPSQKPSVMLDEMVNTFRNSRRTLTQPMLLAANENNTSDDLFSMVQDSKKAPASTSIAVVEKQEGGIPQNVMAIYNDMLTLSSLANVVAMQSVYKDHPEKYNIADPKDATAFVEAQAVALNYVFTNKLGAYALPGQTTAYSYNKTITTAELHLDFLMTLFAGFAFPESAMTELDGILTQVKESLADLKVGVESENETLDHIIFTNYLEQIEIPGSSEKMMTGKIRMFYLKIDQNSWKASISGKASVEKINFKMDYFDTIFSINSELLRTDIQAIQKLVTELTNKSFEEIARLTSPKKINK